MAIDTLIGYGAPGIAMMATESFHNAQEPRYGEGLQNDTSHMVSAGADLDLPLYSVVALSQDGVISLAQNNAASGAASGALTYSGVGTDGDTITIGTTVYTLRAAPTTVANEVKIGATADESAANFAAAVNAGPGAGTAYGSLTERHPSVSASASGAVVTVVANNAGDEGNAIATTESGTMTSWGAATLTSGDDDPDLRPYGILAAPLVLANGAETFVPIIREGHWEMAALNWHASFASDASRKYAFEGSLSPTIHISKKKFANTDIPI